MKRMLSVLLALALVFGTVAASCLTAFAEEELTKITEVKLSGKPTVTIGEVLSAADIAVSADADYEIESIRWYDDDWQVLPEDTKAEDGGAYTLYVSLVPKDGCEFADGSVVSLEIDGVKSNDGYGNAELYSVELRYSFKKQLSKLEITGLDAPVAGQAPDTQVTAMLDGKEVQAIVDWMDENNDAVTTFAEKGRFYASLYVELEDGYEMAENAAVTVNGLTSYYYFGNGYVGITLSYSLGYDVVDKIDITMEGFEEGKHTNDTKVTVTGYEIEMSAWGVTEGDSLNAVKTYEGTFEKNTTYIYGVILVLPENKVVDSFTKIYINGKLAEKSVVMMETDNYAIVYALPLTLETPVTPATPATGDNMPVYLLGAVMALSAVMLIALPVAYKHKEV